jgi:hypothetical protein
MVSSSYSRIIGLTRTDCHSVSIAIHHLFAGISPDRSVVRALETTPRHHSDDLITSMCRSEKIRNQINVESGGEKNAHKQSN